MFLVIIQALYLFLPSYTANAVPVFLTKFKLWEKLNIPVDFHYKYKGEFLIGPTKTYRGILGGILGAFVMVSLQAFLYFLFPTIRFLYLFPYSFPSILLLGFFHGCGEGFGDVIKSFFKRRLHVQSSEKFFPFDQLSFLGSLLLGSLYFIPPKEHILAIVLISPGIPIIANIIAYKFGWKKVWW